MGLGVPEGAGSLKAGQIFGQADIGQKVGVQFCQLGPALGQGHPQTDRQGDTEQLASGGNKGGGNFKIISRFGMPGGCPSFVLMFYLAPKYIENEC